RRTIVQRTGRHRPRRRQAVRRRYQCPPQPRRGPEDEAGEHAEGERRRAAEAGEGREEVIAKPTDSCPWAFRGALLMRRNRLLALAIPFALLLAAVPDRQASGVQKGWYEKAVNKVEAKFEPAEAKPGQTVKIGRAHV